jgi:hypothetical protein
MATGDEVLEEATGTINGVNKDFQTSLPYQADTLRVWVTGILVRRGDDDGWTESDPSTGDFQMKEAPRIASSPDDTLHVRYIEE